MVLAERLRPPRSRQVATVRVRVKGAYEPSVVHGRVGEPLRIVFSRAETASCSEHVVFPAFGKSAMLPPFEDVAVELVPERAGEYEFTCQTGMLRGRLVVEGDETARESALEPVLAGRARSPWRKRVADEREDTVLLAFVAWLCSLPLLLLLAVPFLGWQVGGLLAVLWFGVVATGCFAVCVRRVGNRESADAIEQRLLPRQRRRSAPPGTVA